MNPSIVLITDSYLPFNDASSRLNYKLVSFLAESYDVTVFAPLPLTSFTLKQSISQDDQGIYLRRVPLPFFYSKNPILKSLRFFALAIFASLYVIFKRNPRSMYLIHSSPPILIPFFAVLIPLRNLFSRRMRRLVLVVHDLYPDIVSSSSLKMRFVSALSGLSSRLFCIAYNSYDLILPCSPGISHRLVHAYDVPPRNIIPIYNCSLYEKPYSHDWTSTLSPISSSSYPQVFVIGNLGPLHLPLASSRFLSALSDELSQPIVLHCRGSAFDDFLGRLDSKSGSFDCRGWVDVKELNRSFENQASITFVSLCNTASSCAFPSRISTSLSWGVPVLFFTDDASGNFISDFISSNDVGIVVTPADSIETVLFSLSHINLHYDTYSQRCKRVYNNLMSSDNYLCSYKEAISSFYPTS